MCIFGGRQQTTAGAPAVRPTINQDTGLQKPKDLTTDTEASVEFGSSEKKGGAAEAKRTGTDALKINLNADAGGSETGGVNV